LAAFLRQHAPEVIAVMEKALEEVASTSDATSDQSELVEVLERFKQAEEERRQQRKAVHLRFSEEVAGSLSESSGDDQKDNGKGERKRLDGNEEEELEDDDDDEKNTKMN
jgi:hypothetical protein